MFYKTLHAADHDSSFTALQSSSGRIRQHFSPIFQALQASENARHPSVSFRWEICACGGDEFFYIHITTLSRIPGGEKSVITTKHKVVKVIDGIRSLWGLFNTISSQREPQLKPKTFHKTPKGAGFQQEPQLRVTVLAWSCGSHWDFQQGRSSLRTANLSWGSC